VKLSNEEYAFALALSLLAIAALADLIHYLSAAP
jgi:hypothetical protein